jgi:hypothetical protein
LEFKITDDENNNYLDLTIHRHNTKLSLEIYRKPTQRDITIHFTSNNPFEQKVAAFVVYINRKIILPITEQGKQREWNTILTIAKNNGFPLHIIHNLKRKLITKKEQINTPKDKMDYIHLSQSTYTQSN